MVSGNEPTAGGTDRPDHPGGEWVTLRLTALQQDVLYHHLMDTMDETDAAYQIVLGDILDKMPEENIVSRALSMETLIEIGYIDGQLASFDVDSPVVGGGRDGE